MAIITCTWCGKQRYRRPCKVIEKPFCSHTCMGEYKKSLYPEGNCICVVCQKVFRTNPAYIRRTPSYRRFCSRECNYKYMRKNEGNETNYTDNQGYKFVTTQGKKRRYHRYLMEQKLGRKLDKKEHVHHINGNKQDNRIENLVVLSESEHHSIESKKRWERDKLSKLKTEL